MAKRTPASFLRALAHAWEKHAERVVKPAQGAEYTLTGAGQILAPISEALEQSQFVEGVRRLKRDGQGELARDAERIVKRVLRLYVPPVDPYNLDCWAAELEEAAFQLAGIAGTLEETTRRKITRPEAEAWAVKLAEKNVALLSGGLRGLANEISRAAGKTCSTWTANKTSVWQNSGRQREKGAPLKAVAFTKKAQAVCGEGDKDEVLNKLIAQEEGQAIAAVMASGMKKKEKAATIAKVEAGTMTPQQAVEAAGMFPRRPKQTRQRRRIRRS